MASENVFQKVHRLAREERLKRHARGCIVCLENPEMCVIRAQIQGVKKSDWLKQQKG